MKTEHIVITIGRMMGSGGAMLGKAISDRYGFHYIDKEFLVEAAETLHSDPESLEYVDEHGTPSWASWGENMMCDTPYITSEAYHVPTSTQLFNVQTQIMKQAVEQGPCVIIGRCSPHLFRNYPKHISIFLQADLDVRLDRMEREVGKRQEREQAKKYLLKEDKARAKYYHNFTGKKWTDMDEYDFMLDTTPYTDEQIQEIVFNLIEITFPELKK